MDFFCDYEILAIIGLAVLYKMLPDFSFGSLALSEESLGIISFNYQGCVVV